MNLSETFRGGSQPALFELLAAVGLALNALVVSSQVPITGKYLHGASLFMFGVGAVGLALVYALPHAEQTRYIRTPMAVYGGIILGVTTGAIFGGLAAAGKFNNLLAVLLLAGFAVMYVVMWRRLKTYEKSDLWLHH